MDIILFGMQGSGKGTVSRAVAQEFDMELFEAGEQLRKLAQEDTPLGIKVKNLIDAGNLVPNEVLMEIVENFMEKADKSKNIIFDGIPRFEEQAQSLNAILDKNNRNYKALILEISENTAIKRLTTRKMCKDCGAIYPAHYNKIACEKCEGKLITRADDVPDAIKRRLDHYKEKTIPAIKIYEDKLIKINGEPAIEPVRENVFEVLRKILQ